MDEGKADKAPAPNAVLEGNATRPPTPPPCWASKLVALKVPTVMVNSRVRLKVCILAPLPSVASFSIYDVRTYMTCKPKRTIHSNAPIQ